MNGIGWIAACSVVLAGCGGETVDRARSVDHVPDASAGAGGATSSLGTGGQTESAGAWSVEAGGVIQPGPRTPTPDAAMCGIATTNDPRPASETILFLVDRSSGWNGDGGAYWAAVAEAIDQFVGERYVVKSLVALGYFPSPPKGDAGPCGPGFELALPLTPASGASLPFKVSLQEQVPAGPRALQSSLGAALEYENANAQPSFPKRVVVVTGGANECSTEPGGTLGDVINAYPGVTTTLLGVGPGLSSNASLTQPFADSEFVDTADTARIEQALARLSGLGAPCSFPVPPPPHGPQDYDRINVTLIPFEGSPYLLYFVQDAAGCAGNGGTGWYYDTTVDPRKIVLCDASCAATPGAELQAVIECGVRVPP